MVRGASWPFAAWARQARTVATWITETAGGSRYASAWFASTRTTGAARFGSAVEPAAA